MVFPNPFSQYIRHKAAPLGITVWVVVMSELTGGAIASEGSLASRSTQNISTAMSSQRSSQLLGSGGSSQSVDLTFTTDRYWVTVFRQNGQIYMTVFDQQSQSILLENNPAVLISDSGTFWRTYRSTLGSIEVFARNNPNGNTELEIFSGGQQAYFGRGTIGAPTQPGGTPTTPINQPGTQQSTLLAFDTAEYRVQVYRQGQTYLDLLDRRTNTFLIQQAPAAIAPPRQVGDTSRTYVTQGAFQAVARLNSNQSTELELWSNGGQVYRANGSNPSGSDTGFAIAPSTGYLGNDFEVPNQARITERAVNLRDRISTDGLIVATLLQCTTVNVLQKTYSATDRYIWYWVDVSGQMSGWVRGDLLSVGQTACS
ncbi:MAG: SH3 domain-containing protein [Cyanobacteria bacterium P01_E01_bin.6]